MPTYAPLPGQRLFYDLDGTIVTCRRLTDSYTLLPADLARLNDEDDDTFVTPFVDGSNNKFITFLFPELRQIVGVYANGFNLTSTRIETSVDTITGQDGTWTAALNPLPVTNITVIPHWRASAQAITVANNNIKGLRIVQVDINATSQWRAFHIYGNRLSVTGLDFWDPTLDQQMAADRFDLGDLAVGTVSSKTFRLKNRHATQTANGIVVSAVDVSTTMVTEYSIGGGAYALSLNIGNLAPGIISGLITMRRTVPSNETTRVQASRVQAVATSWT